MKGKIVILFGGESVEHDISIITALQVMDFLPEKGNVLPIYIDKNGLWWKADNLDKLEIYQNFEEKAKNKVRLTFLLGQNVLLEQKKGKFVEFCKVESVLNCCHGRLGEDGRVQGLLDVCKTPYTSPAMTESALCMDKVFLKDVLEKNNIKTPLYCHFDIDTYDNASALVQIKKMGLPVVVKPANLGSSIGISVCTKIEQVEEAIKLAFSFDKKVLIEEFVEHLREFNCAAFYFQNQIFVSSVAEVKNKSQIFTFEDKYLDKDTKTHEIDQKLTKKIKKLTEKIYRLLNLRGVVRIDFLYDSKNRILYVNEINTIPGSLAFYLFKDIKFVDILDAVIEQSLADFSKEQKFVKTFDSDALKIFSQTKTAYKK